MRSILCFLFVLVSLPVIAQPPFPGPWQVIGDDPDPIIASIGETRTVRIYLEQCGFTPLTSGSNVNMAINWDEDVLTLISATVPANTLITGFVDNINGVAQALVNPLSVSGVCSDPDLEMMVCVFEAIDYGDSEVRLVNSTWDGVDNIGGMPFERIRVDHQFVRGDANGNGIYDIADATAILGYVAGTSPLFTCEQALDVNDDDSIGLTDGIQMLNWLFNTPPATPPAAPFNACGFQTNYINWFAPLNLLDGPCGTCP